MSDKNLYVFEFEGHFYLSNVKQAYATLEALCVENRAGFKDYKKVLFLRETPLRLLKLPHTEKLTDADLIAALSYECASLLNLSTEEVALSIIRHDDLSLYPTDFFLSTFERTMLVERIKVFQKYHLKTISFLSLDQALFLSHFKQESMQKSVMFLLLEQRMMAIIPQENENYHVRNLNMGAQELRSNPSQFASQVKRRLNMDEHQRIVMYTPKTLLPFQNQIQTLLQFSQFEVVELESVLELLADNEIEKHICTTHVEVVAPSNPFRALTLLLVVVLLVFGGLFAHHLNTLNKNASLAEALRLRQELNQTVSLKQAQVTQLKKRFTDLEKQYAFFQHHLPFNASFFKVVQLLSRYKLFHTRVLLISLEDTSVVVCGESQDQKDFTKFITHFQTQLQKENLRLYMQEFAATSDVNFKASSQTQIPKVWQNTHSPTPQGQSKKSDARWHFKFSISKEALK